MGAAVRFVGAGAFFWFDAGSSDAVSEAGGSWLRQDRHAGGHALSRAARTGLTLKGAAVAGVDDLPRAAEQ